MQRPAALVLQLSGLAIVIFSFLTLIFGWFSSCISQPWLSLGTLLVYLVGAGMYYTGDFGRIIVEQKYPLLNKKFLSDYCWGIGIALIAGGVIIVADNPAKTSTIIVLLLLGTIALILGARLRRQVEITELNQKKGKRR